MNLPKFQCHKVVGAIQIKGFENIDGKTFIVTELGQQIELTEEYLKKHDPQFGGYYVEYEDGYKSFSPERAFEDGYTPIKLLKSGDEASN